jgi:Disulphide bond corrector protein DsbC
VLLSSAVCCLCLPLFCRAQQNKLVVTPAAPITVKHGGTATQSLRVTVLPGFHVNSDKPKDEYLIPLKLTWTGGPLDAVSIAYPKPEEVKVGTDMLRVFTGTFQIQTEFKARENAATGASTVTGKLRYQACNSDMCFRPATADVTVPVTIE